MKLNIKKTNKAWVLFTLVALLTGPASAGATPLKGNVNQCLSLMLTYHSFSGYIPEVRSEFLNGRFGNEISQILNNTDVFSQSALKKMPREDRVRTVEYCRRILTVKQSLGQPLFETELSLKLARETIAIYKYQKDDNAGRFRSAITSALFDLYEAEQYFRNSRFPDKFIAFMLDRIQNAESHINSARSRFESEWFISQSDQLAIIEPLDFSLREMDIAIRTARVERFRNIPRTDGLKESFIGWLTWPGDIQVP